MPDTTVSSNTQQKEARRRLPNELLFEMANFASSSKGFPNRKVRLWDFGRLGALGIRLTDLWKERVFQGKMSSASMVLWYFTVDEEETAKNCNKNAKVGEVGQQQPDRTSSGPVSILPSGFHLRLYGINTTDGAPLTLKVIRVDGERVLTGTDDDGQLRKCNLIGQLNRNEALKAGFPSDVVSEFQHGFPTDHWKLLLHRHVEMILERRKKTAVAIAEGEVSLVCWSFSLKFVEKQELVQEYGIIRGYGIILCGFRTDNGDQLESSPITEVLDRDLVRTETRVYRLVGQINRKVCIQSGVPVELIDKFENGFPGNWITLLRLVNVVPPSASIPKKRKQSGSESPLPTKLFAIAFDEHEREDSPLSRR